MNMPPKRKKKQLDIGTSDMPLHFLHVSQQASLVSFDFILFPPRLQEPLSEFVKQNILRVALYLSKSRMG